MALTSGTRIGPYEITGPLGSVPQFGSPAVKSGRWAPGLPWGRLYDVTPDGRALLLLSEPTQGRELQVILNFDEVIRRRISQIKQ